jgi:hypothetical protein
MPTSRAFDTLEEASAFVADAMRSDRLWREGRTYRYAGHYFGEVVATPLAPLLPNAELVERGGRKLWIEEREK